MHKRYLRIDLEYDMDINPIRLQSYAILNNLRRILEEDMPYLKILSMKDAPTREALDK
jgi:hypothetical protein